MRISTARRMHVPVSYCLLVMLLLLQAPALLGQQTVSYPQRRANYYALFNNSADAFDQGSHQLGLWANGSGSKQVVLWRRFRADGGSGSSSTRNLQAGDRVTITLSATRAWGRIGFALLANPLTGSWDNRESNMALSVNLDGPLYAPGATWGNWYVRTSNSTSTASYGGSTSYVEYTFTITLTAPGRANLTISDNLGRNTSFPDLQLATSAAITDYAVYLQDDWNGSTNSNIFWGLSSGVTHSVTNTGSISLGGSGSSFTVPGAIGNGLDANSASANNLNNALTKTGSGTLTLSGQSSFTGGTTVSSGTLWLNAASGNTLAANSDVSVASGATLRISSNQELNNLSVASGGSLIVDDNVTLTLNGSVSLAGTASYAASSTVVFAGNSTAQTVPAYTYGNLTLSGSGNKSLASSGTIGIAGAFSVSATTPVSSTGSTIDYSAATAQTIATFNYHHLSNSGNGNRIFASSGAHNGVVDIAGTFSPGSGSYTVDNSTVSYTSNATGTFNLPSFSVTATTLNPGARAYHHLMVGPASASSTIWRLPAGYNLGTIGNFTLNQVSEFRVCDQATANGLTVGGNFVKNGGNLFIAFNSGAGSLRVAGNFINQSGSVFVSGNNTQTSAPGGGYMEVTGDVTMNSGALTLIADPNCPNTVLSVAGSVHLNAGRLALEGASNPLASAFVGIGGDLNILINATNAISFGASSTAQIAGNTVMLAGHFNKSASLAQIQALGTNLPTGFVFSGSSVQNFTWNGNSGSSFVPWTVEAGSTLRLQTNWPLGTLSTRLPAITINGTLDAGVYKLAGMPAGSQITLNGKLLTAAANGVDDASYTMAASQSTLGGLGSGVMRVYDPNSFVVEFNGSTAQQTNLPEMVSDLIINNPAGVQLSANLGVSNTLTLEAGTFNAATYQLTLGGAILRDGSSQTGFLDASNAALWFNGSADVTIPAGTLTHVGELALLLSPSGTVTLSNNLTVANGIVFNRTLLDIGNHTLSMPTHNIVGGSSDGYIRMSSTGSVIVRGVENSGNLIPVGGSTFNPLVILSPDVMDWTLRVEDSITNVEAPFQSNLQRAVQRMWHLTPAVNPLPGDGATVLFGYSTQNPGELGALFDTLQPVQLWHYSNGNWVAAGAATTPLVFENMRLAAVSQLRYFSPFALSNVGAPLPVTLLGFTGRRTASGNELKWATASEQNNRGFVVQRSRDGRSYSEVGFVGAATPGGNSNSTLHYSFTDAAAGAGDGRWHYRLRQEDIDGRFKYSPVVLISGDRSGLLRLEGVYPNPVAGGVLNVRLQGGQRGGAVLLQLTDNQGRVLQVERVAVEARSSITHTLEVNELPSGVYYLRAYDAEGGVSESVRVVK